MYKDLGMKLIKIHRVLQFDESPWLAKYINFNTERRKEAKYALEKDYFKLMNNVVFCTPIQYKKHVYFASIILIKFALLNLS